MLLSGVAVLAVLAGGSLCLSRGVFSPGQASGRATVSSRATAAGCGAAGTGPCTTSQAGLAVAVPPAVVTVPPRLVTARLRALTVTSGLDASSSAHNLRMADGCGLSHQCPGEPALGDRETAAGVGWTAAGENIGEGGPVADTTAAIAQMAVGLTQSMLNEQPPDDGHRLNILSSTFTRVGIAVYRDGSGTVWLTQDFSN